MNEKYFKRTLVCVCVRVYHKSRLETITDVPMACATQNTLLSYDKGQCEGVALPLFY